MSDVKLNKLAAEVRKDFSDEEIARFVAVAKSVVQKTILYTIAKIVEDAANGGVKSAEVGKKLSSDILGLITEAGSRPLPVPAGDGEILVMLAPCKPDWVTKVAVPDKETQSEVITRYEYIRRASHSFWNSFLVQQPAICARIVEYMPEVEWQIHPALPTTSTTMWFDKNSSHHMGIICAYLVDKQVHPF